MKRSCYFAELLTLSLCSITTVLSQELWPYLQNFDGCSTSEYYNSLGDDPNTWTREDVASLVTTTHRHILTLEGLGEALLDLDRLSEAGPGVIELIFSASTINTTITSYNQQDGWNREPLWPENRGAFGAYATTDIHNNRPERTRRAMVRRDMMFGECGTVEFSDVCKIPVFVGAPSDTAQDGKVWTPAAAVRGDIARAMFYMELRYQDTELNLQIVDCPPFAGRMGFLSQLLEWHMFDPISEVELSRNDDSCERWQGNRNPFVDHPELVSRFFGDPQEIAPGTRTYPSCLDVPTPAPTSVPNGCNELYLGDIFIFVFDSHDTVGVGFLALEDIPGGLELMMTDNPWTGTDFNGTEGTLKFIVPSAGIKAGEQFGYGLEYDRHESWIREEGDFILDSDGDSVFLYCLLGDNSIRPLLGFSNAGAWAEAGLDPSEYGSTESALPDDLLVSAVGYVILPHVDNYVYTGPSTGAKLELQQSMMNPDYWTGSNTSSANTTTTTDSNPSSSPDADADTQAPLFLNQTLAPTLTSDIFSRPITVPSQAPSTFPPSPPTISPTVASSQSSTNDPESSQSSNVRPSARFLSGCQRICIVALLALTVI